MDLAQARQEYIITLEEQYFATFDLRRGEGIYILEDFLYIEVWGGDMLAKLRIPYQTDWDDFLQMEPSERIAWVKQELDSRIERPKGGPHDERRME